ncbi:MAG: hypothetical protein L6R42_006936 [Xanthoria sp. 1 TBL-2021]|nr:MAG: hypothetical protein L6R42_006936 [Xanthoria sp. 1 TBL-2021]
MTLWCPVWLAKVKKSPSEGQRTDRNEECHLSNSEPSKRYQKYTKKQIDASSWKPVTLRRPFLLGIVGVTLAFIALLEYLSRRSRRDGGIAFTKGQFSPAVSFAYQNLPATIAVLYSILWSWVDLDTKRLEPYFQLSRPEGADRTDSLALSYPFDFMAYAPLKALRRRHVAQPFLCSGCLILFYRHWAVVFAGTSTMLILSGVTPLVGAVFARSVVTVEHLATATTSAALIPLRDQRLAMNTDFMMTAYGIVWLGQAMPGFVTPQGFFEPFRMDMKQEAELLNATWKARTKLYGTSLNCRAANIRNESTGFSYSNGKDCTTEAGSTPVELDTGSQFGCLYIGYEMDQHADYSLSDMGCPSPSNQHQFLAVWGQSLGGDRVTNVSAAFCEPTYWTQEVNATVTVPSMNVTEISPLGPRITLPDGLFNRTAFEYGIGTGAQAISERADISETTNIVDQKSQVAKFGLLGTVTNMVGFALGLNPTDLTDFADPTILAASFENAHKLLHALAMRQLMSSNAIEVQSRQGTISGKISAITTVRPFAIVVEVLLGLVVTLILALMTYTCRRPSQLCNNPASLIDVIAIAADDDENFDSTDETGPEASRSRFRLVNGRICLSRPHVASHVPNCGNSSADARPSLTESEVENSKSLARPIAMSMTVACIFLLTLLLALTTVIALTIYAKKHDGLPVPSNHTAVNKLVLNYVLVMFATVLEPFWLLLNRQLCVLQPFEELRQANAPASRSLKLKYTSLPPQMNIWNAFRAKHYVLGAVCAIGLSANLLAISLNGLLQIEFFPMADQTYLPRRYEEIFAQNQVRIKSGSDYQYVAKANLSDGVSLPPWTTSETFFVPFDVKAKSKYGSVGSIQASTRGFSIRPKCERAKFNDTALVTGRPNSFFTEQRTPSGGTVFCGGAATPFGGQNNTNAALEVLVQLQPVDLTKSDTPAIEAVFDLNATEEETRTCRSIVVAGFLRANLTVSINDAKTDNSKEAPTPEIQRINSLSSLWMMCKSSIATAPYKVTVVPSGHVESYVAIGPELKDPVDSFSNGTSPTSLIISATWVLARGQDTIPYWHNDTFVDTWFAYFIKHLSNSTMFVDPEQPVPVFEQVVPYVEDLYARLFAIVLSLNQGWLAEAKPVSTIPGVLFVSSQRVFVSRPMFVITVVLLVANMAVAILHWTRRPKKMLPTMPYTIGSILAMIHASGLKREARNQEDWKKDWKFGYGRFVGTDGKPHVGIERRPFVQPLDT